MGSNTWNAFRFGANIKETHCLLSSSLHPEAKTRVLRLLLPVNSLAFRAQAPCEFHSSLLLSCLRAAITQRCHGKIASHNRPDDYFAMASISSPESRAVLLQSTAELGQKQIKNNKWTVFDRTKSNTHHVIINDYCVAKIVLLVHCQINTH